MNKDVGKMISDGLDDLIFDRAVFDKNISNTYAVKLANLVVDKIIERFGVLLSGIAFCLEVRDKQYFFERERPEISDLLESLNTRLSVCAYINGAFERVVTVRCSDTPAAILERAYSNFARVFFGWNTPFRRALIKEHVGDYKKGLISLGLNYSWSLVRFAGDKGSDLHGSIEGRSDVVFPYGKHSGLKITENIFKAAISKDSKIVVKTILKSKGNKDA